ncbi:unnamed protein product [Rhizophagus irregularis]|nr:unnamed protein product [Rhizophagus irregularis]CAB5383341.1 unnamed protein product [Rhizophagus irregularis]
MQECEKLIMVQANDSERSKYIKDSMTNDKRLDAISKEKPKLKSDQWIRVGKCKIIVITLNIYWSNIYWI